MLEMILILFALDLETGQSREATGQSEKIEEQLKGTGGVKAEGAQEKH